MQPDESIVTLLMVWREGPHDRLWIVGDSRISSTGEGGLVVPLTDRAAKILEARILLEGDSPRAPPIRTRTVGFAYTGSSLVALQSYAAVIPLWTRLRSSGEQLLPTMSEFAAHLGIFVRAYTHELAVSGSFDCQTECVLLGFDERADVVEAWSIRAAPTPQGINLAVNQIFLGNGAMVLFGSGKQAALESLSQIRPNDGEWGREPLEMIRRQLGEDAPGTVGGGVQIGLAIRDGFEIYSDARPFRVGISRVGDSLLAMRYRGFDLDEVGRVGHAFASLAGVVG